jgi:hypothetical protein
MTTELVQAWRFAFLVGVGFLAFSITLRYYFHDRRDGIHVLLTLTGAALVLIANRSIESSNGTSAFLILVGAGTFLFLLGALVSHLVETVVTDAPPE